MRAFQKQSLSKCFTGSAGRFKTLKTVRRLAQIAFEGAVCKPLLAADSNPATLAARCFRSA